MPSVVIKARPEEQKTVKRMNVRTINPFIVAAVSVIRENTGLSVAKRNVFVQQGKFTPAGTGMVMNINGQLQGKIVYEFSRGVAARLSQRMIERNIDMKTSAVDFKDMLNAAILELGNQIAGKAITLLEKEQVNCSISSPDFYLGKDLQLIHPHLKTIVLILDTEYGDFSINLSVYSG